LIGDVVQPLVLNGDVPLMLTVGQNARLSFRAQAGTGYGIAITGLSFTPANGSLDVALRQADGTFITHCPFSAAGSCDLGPISFATTGTYFLDFDPGGLNAASFNAVVSTDITGTIAVDADPAIVTIARPGQNARYSFNGTAGQLVSVTVSNNALDDGLPGNNTTTISVLTPTGSAITRGSFDTATPTVTLLTTLPLTGLYSIFVTPSNLDSGAFTLGVH
jgi:hypothetical protein